MKQIKTILDKLNQAVRVLEKSGHQTLANSVLAASEEFKPQLDLSEYTEKLVKFGKAELPLLEK